MTQSSGSNRTHYRIKVNGKVLRDDLPELLKATFANLSGSVTIIEVCKKFWADNESKLRRSGDLLYTWQYDIRWAATTLRKTGIMKDASVSESGVWELK